MIRNKITESGVLTLDLMDFFDASPRYSIDLADWLENGLIIKEAPFKNRLSSFDLAPLKGACISIFCSTNAIIPTWAYLLLQAKIHNVAKDVFFGDHSSFELYLFQKKVNRLDLNKYKNKRVFIKSCQNKQLPVGAFSIVSGLLIPQVKSLFYGEPCSSVPLIKN